MDMIILKKKLSSYLSPKGQLRNLSEDILYEVLMAWESWTAASPEFYRSLGFSQKQLAGLLGKAKKLRREGRFGSEEFKQVTVDAPSQAVDPNAPCAAVEIVWTNGQVIRFSGVDYLMDFLKKSA